MSSFAGPEYLADLNSYQETYDRERAKVILAGRVADFPLSATLRRQGQMRKVGSTQPFEWEDYPLAYKGTLTGVGAALTTTATTFTIANASTIFTPADLIGIPRYQDNNSNTSRLIGMEICPIVSIDNTTVTVQRNNGSATATYNVSTAASATTLNWVRLAAANVEGAGVGVARSRNLANKLGRLQYLEKVWEMTREDYLTKSYGPDKKERLKRLALDALNCEADASFCWGENVVVNSNGKPRPETEGLIHRIATADTDAGTAAWATTTDLVTGTTDNSSRIWNLDGQQQWTLENWKKFVVQAGEYVSDKRLMALHGKFFLPRMESLYNGQVTYMPNDFKNLGFSVHSFETNGVVLDFVHWTPLDDAGMVRDLVTVDISNISVPYFEDIWHEDLNPNGAQIVYGHFLAKMGLQISNVLTHSLLTGMPSS